jgi:hypothetical protein
MRQMSLKISIIIFFIAVWGHASACPPEVHVPVYPAPAYLINKCGQYGCVGGRPAVVPGRPYAPVKTETIITIIRK